MGRKEKTLLITIIANVVLIALRFFLADLSGSVGLAANAWHSMTDAFVTSVVFVGLMVARYGADKLKLASKKVEHILAIFVAVFIFYMGLEILSDALSGETTELRYVPFAAAGAFLGIGINYFMARYKIYVGQQTGSQSLIADGYHSKMDMYCSVAVLVGLLGSLFGMPSLDKIAAIIAMVLLMIAGYEILSSNLHLLLHPEEDTDGEHDHQHHGLPGGKKLYAGVGGVLLCAWLLSGIYVVQMDESGIVRRFGSVVNDAVTPGIHYKLPAPIETVTLVRADNVRQMETGVQELLTGDTNLVNVNLSVHYKIQNSADYLLNVSNSEALLQSSATTSIRQIVGENTIDYTLTDGKPEIEATVQQALQEAMDWNGTGLEIVSVQLVEAAPPDAVLSSFEDLATARQDSVIYINEATAYQNTIVPQARAKAYQQIAEAEGYRENTIKTAQGDADLFAQRQEAYASYSRVTRFRLYMETMEEVLPNVQKLLLGGNVSIDNAELWLGNGSK